MTAVEQYSMPLSKLNQSRWPVDDTIIWKYTHDNLADPRQILVTQFFHLWDVCDVTCRKKKMYIHLGLNKKKDLSELLGHP